MYLCWVLPIDEVLSFHLSISDNNCSSLDFLWDFGDGNVSNEKNPNHSYTTPGKYRVTASVVCDHVCGEIRDHVWVTATHICGPDISAQLIDLLRNVRSTFLGKRWTRTQKEDLCDAVRSLNPLKLRQTLNAWDICHLFLPNTYWLYNSKFKKNSCGMPAKGEPGTLAIETLPGSPCGNSVQVGEHCYLAGTVNYALFGEISRLCHDEFEDRLDMQEMKGLIGMWKTFDSDDPIPPIAWAEWAYNRSPLSAVPTGRAANRDYCERLCEPLPNVTFTWNWLPHQESCPGVR